MSDSMRRLHVLLGVQSLLLVLASVNRLWSATDEPVLPDDALRLVDVLNLFVIAPASALAFYVLLEYLLTDVPERLRLGLRVAFAAALYLFAASYGMHEPADYIHAEFCGGGDDGALCQAVAAQDDGVSHGLYFAGLIGIAAVLLFAQAATATIGTRPRGRDRRLVLANAALVALAIAANLGFEEIGIDAFVVALIALLAAALWWRRGPRALTLYFAIAYGVGLGLTVIAQAAGGG